MVTDDWPEHISRDILVLNRKHLGKGQRHGLGPGEYIDQGAWIRTSWELKQKNAWHRGKQSRNWAKQGRVRQYLCICNFCLFKIHLHLADLVLTNSDCFHISRLVLGWPGWSWLQARWRRRERSSHTWSMWPSAAGIWATTMLSWSFWRV